MQTGAGAGPAGIFCLLVLLDSTRTKGSCLTFHDDTRNDGTLSF